MTCQVWSLKWHGRAALYRGRFYVLSLGMKSGLKCDHLNQTASLCCCLSVSYKVLNIFLFCASISISKLWTLKWTLLNRIFLRYCLLCCTRWILYRIVLIFESVDKTLKCNHSNQSYGAVLSPGAVLYAVQGGSNIFECTHKILAICALAICVIWDENY